MTARSWWSKLQGLPAPVVDVALAVGLTAAVTIAIGVAPEQGDPPGPAAFALGPAIGGLALFRRRWPLVVLVISGAALMIYNVPANPGIFAAVPLSVALATSWTAGHRLWALLIAIWFSGSPLIYVALTELPDETADRVLSGVVSDMALMAAVLLLGEALRGRRALGREHRLLLAERERSEALLLNILPASIADRLRQSEEVIADHFPDVTVMFADVVDFTQNSREVGPDLVVQELNDLFSTFDGLARIYGLEKIKTIGDAYMAAGGLPEPRPDHPEAVAEMALAIREDIAGRRDPAGRPLAVRIGIDTGPVVAGVIGKHKFAYDLWGDTVNTASRMESSGVPGSIQVTERTHRRLQAGYRFERRGAVQVKGKGEMVTWFLLGRDDAS